MPPKGFKEWFEMVATTTEDKTKDRLPIKQQERQFMKKPLENKEVSVAGVFDRLDEIILEIMILKKELSASLDK